MTPKGIMKTLYLAWLRHCLACLESEVKCYRASSVPLGPQYIQNCSDQAFDLRSRISALECGINRSLR